MVTRPCLCGIDVGTQGVRVALVALDGRELGHGARRLPASRREAGIHEQSPDDWWEGLVGALREATASDVEAEVVAVALDATSGTVVLEAPDGAPRGPALMYDDARAVVPAERAERVGRELWTELGYRMQPTWGLPKAMWLMENAAPGTGDRIVHQSDHLVRRLTGRRVATDTSHALKTGADLRTASWPSAVLAELGLPVSRLPELVSPGTVIGRVDGDVARLTGLPAGVSVRAGMTDGCAAQIAAGSMRAGSWSSALGTTLVVKGSTAELVRDPQGAVYCHRHPDGGWLPGGASSTGAGAFRELLQPTADLDDLTRRASSRPLVGGVSYPLAGRGERFPFVAPQAHGFLTEQAVDDVDRFATTCLGIAYVERLAYDVLATLGADVSGPVALTGGATRNDWWNQLRTDVLGRRTTRPASPEAATGMAILAAAEPGHLAETADGMVAVVERLEPDIERGRDLDAGYRRLLEALADRGWLAPDLADAVLAPPAVTT